ncbi:flavin reductase family protein [uncultured Rummeliibacillus sp.]|uniref:flavin reductase family protein n=1 Tax=uncultured Rummeliibacillus sp. TaxID=762292 RepID=UPI0026155B27|nr:flavin reductase family protein [uncultured Rummeliibacillus sp.]
MTQQDDFKKALGNYPTGVTVVTTFDKENNPVGLTVNSFASVSLDPLLILWSIDKRAKSLSDFTYSKKFAVNILASDQDKLCFLFSSKEIDRFGQCEWKRSDDDLPILENVASVLECEKVQEIEAGDHIILIGQVYKVVNTDKAPLLYHKRNVGRIPKTFYQII